METERAMTRLKDHPPRLSGCSLTHSRSGYATCGGPRDDRDRRGVPDRGVGCRAALSKGNLEVPAQLVDLCALPVDFDEISSPLGVQFDEEPELVAVHVVLSTGQPCPLQHAIE